ncbi:hypothetical protein GCM10010840_01210 [Deinococcus aerolatus]|uniref:Outer membrane protein beta-barrel domain-containing protein n=1 Tax=Deinococcus aerolatus TaxID=522487 RepID=A0ABQ2FYX7_9DEIO|nr:hypothetical protein [Deinococcus aerolatus]GGL67005.1 hypothetical protein GCM10010840_01210 [Deinococcus aerolatus]
MKKLISLTILAAAATAAAQSFNNIELGLTGGYAGGLSGEAFVHAPNVVGPVGIKVGVAYTRPSDSIRDSSDIGAGPFSGYKAAGATESGSATVISVDGTYGLGEVAPGIDTMVYGGARYGMFKGTEDYGSGLTTTYSSNSFGLGAGAMASYALTGNLSLVGDLGADYFFKSTIDRKTNTAAGPTSDSYATGDANYNDFNNRFVRPGTNFKARLGIKYMF